VRRSNPRSADIPGGRQGLIALLLRQLGFLGKGPEEDLVSPTRFHRILRRGREYGKTLSPAAAADPNAPDLDSGINFICLNANISRQFEFIQNAWAMNSKFNGMTGESDPVIGNREPLANGERTDTFRQPQKSGLPRVTKDLPQFITVKGGAYFFLPGLRALRFIAGAGKDA
jgi:deferrochelatase/peroxidase EfeB